MAKILTTLRTHWKKSIFFTCVAGFGVKYGKGKYDDKQLMKQYCKEALVYGEPTVPVSHVPYHVTVVLNPAASGGKARTKFESYCAPLLHLAGFKVSVIRTEGEGQAKEILEAVSNCDAVLIAGGDGTLMEAVTGWMRRHKNNKLERFKVPIGILPVGSNNTMAKNIFSIGEASDVKLMADATMSVVRQLYLRPLDVIEIENLSEAPEMKGKRIYGLREIQLGAFKDAEGRMSKYWFFAGLKKYLTYVFAYTTASSEIFWKIQGTFEKCNTVVEDSQIHEQPSTNSSSWSKWISSKLFTQSSQPDVLQNSDTSLIPLVEEWEMVAENFDGCEVLIQSGNNFVLKNEPTKESLQLKLGPSDISFTDFVGEGWKRQSNKKSTLMDAAWQAEEARIFKWNPILENQGEEKQKDRAFTLDGESIEIIGPMKFSLIPEAILMFCSPTNHYSFKHPEEAPVKSQKWWRSTAQKSNLTYMAKPRAF